MPASPARLRLVGLIEDLGDGVEGVTAFNVEQALDEYDTERGAALAARHTEHTNREEAYRRAARATAHLLEVVRGHIELRNYGLATQWIDDTLRQLPHDYGAQEFFTLFDEKLAEVER
jgi:hypothetical protein